jgi:hypothetical protein
MKPQCISQCKHCTARCPYPTMSKDKKLCAMHVSELLVQAQLNRNRFKKLTKGTEE